MRHATLVKEKSKVDYKVQSEAQNWRCSRDADARLAGAKLGKQRFQSLSTELCGEHSNCVPLNVDGFQLICKFILSVCAKFWLIGIKVKFTSDKNESWKLNQARLDNIKHAIFSQINHLIMRV